MDESAGSDEWTIRAAIALERDGADAAFMLHSPGRVNLIGDHIDYSGGLVLPMALDRGTTAVVFPREDATVRGFSVNFPDAGIMSAELAATGYDEGHGWFSYVLGVVNTAQSEGLPIDRGFDMYLSGDIPEGGGLSSSASVEMAVATALEHMFQPGLSPTQWALLAQRAENRYIGVACGIMDQLAIAMGRAGMALLMDCETLECVDVPVPTDLCTVVIASTNQPRQLADSAYNERRAAVDSASRIIGAARGSEVGKLVEVDPAELAQHAALLDEAGVLPFARHTVTEHQRVIAAAAALRRADLPALGALMRQSHESLRDDFQVTGPALDALAESAWATPGVIGARMTGAGFGGCTVNIVTKGRETAVMTEIARRYREATGIEPDLFEVQPSAGAHVLGEG